MAASKAFTLSILFVVAVYVTQCIGKPDPSEARVAFDKLMDANSNLNPDEVLEFLKTIYADPYLREKELGHGLVVWRALYHGEYHYCDKQAMFDLKRLYLQADQFNESLENYLVHQYKNQIDYCEDIALEAFLLFKSERPKVWKQFDEFFRAIQSDKKLYADLGEGGFGMREEIMNLLGDVLRKKNPNIDADYRSQAIHKLLDICETFREFTQDSSNPPRADSLDVVSKLSSDIKRHEGPLFHVKYLYLCERAREMEQEIKQRIDHKIEMKKLQQESYDRIGRWFRAYKAKTDDLN